MDNENRTLGNLRPIYFCVMAELASADTTRSG